MSMLAAPSCPFAPRRRRLAAGLAVLAVAAAGWAWWAVARRPPIPKRTLLIGYQHNPPYQVHRPGQPSDRAVGRNRGRGRAPCGDSARVEGGPGRPRRGTDIGRRGPVAADHRPARAPADALHQRSLDAGPARARAPRRAGRCRAATSPKRSRSPPSRCTFGMVRERFPAAPLVECPEGRDALVKLCTGEVSAAFLESRLALAVLREQPPRVRRRRPARAHAAGRLPARGRRDLRVGGRRRSHSRRDLAAWRTTARSPCCSPATRSSASTTRAPPTTCWRRRQRNRRLLWVIGGLAVRAGAHALAGVVAARRAPGHRPGAARSRARHRRAREAQRRARALHLHRVPRPAQPARDGDGVPGRGRGGRGQRDRRRSCSSDMARIRGAAGRMDRLLKELLELSRVGRTAREPRDG